VRMGGGCSAVSGSCPVTDIFNSDNELKVPPPENYSFLMCLLGVFYLYRPYSIDVFTLA
jgi:hypothetical protein